MTRALPSLALLVTLPLAHAACGGAAERAASNADAGRPTSATPAPAAEVAAASPVVTARPAWSTGAPEAKPRPNVARLRTQAREMIAAFRRGDYEAATDYTHPRLVEMMGGREQTVAFVGSQLGEAKAEGFEIVSFTSGEPRNFLTEGGQIFAVVPTTMRAKTDEGAFVYNSYMIAVSEDGGENWTFVNGERGEERVRTRVLFPHVAERLRLPTPSIRAEP